MLLTIDIGNTQVIAGVFQGNNLLFHFRLNSDFMKTSDEYGVIFSQLLVTHRIEKEKIKNICLSCVVPPLYGTMLAVCEDYFKINPVTVNSNLKMGIEIKMENPAEVGADRLVNAAAVWHLYGKPAIVVDFGTATTFDAITKKGEYAGGAIAPGMGVSLNALVKQTSMLPKIEIKKPEKSIGAGTVSALQSGFFYGYLGLVENLVKKISGEMEGKPVVVATGGMARLIAGESSVINEVDPLLTLTGLRIIFEMNRS